MDERHRRRSGAGDGPWERHQIVPRARRLNDAGDMGDMLPPFLDIPVEENNPYRVSVTKTCIGLLLIVLGVYILNSVEASFIHETTVYEDIVEKAVFIMDSNEINPENDGKLVILSGLLVIDEPLTAPEYGIAATAVYLKQRVQMYQWNEETEYDGKVIYATAWKDRLIDSDHFLEPEHHINPREFPFQSKMIESDKVRIGAYFLSKYAKKEFTDFIPITSDERPENKGIKLHSGIYYHTDDVWNPQVGDIRVQFSFAGQSEKTWTITGKQVRNEIYPYEAGSLYILHLQEGVRTLDKVMPKYTLNPIEMGAKRLGIFGLIFLGMYLLIQGIYNDQFRPDSPRWMFACSCLRLTFSLSALLSFSVAGYLWLFYHQNYGIFLICIGFIPFFYIMIYFIE